MQILEMHNITIEIENEGDGFNSSLDTVRKEFSDLKTGS